MSIRFISSLKLIFLKKNLFLVLAIAAFGLALILLIFTENAPLNTVEDESSFADQSKINNLIRASNEDLVKITSLVSMSNDTTFSYLKTSTKYPYFIFKNGRLIFWSDYQFVPDYQLVEGNYKL